MRDHLEFDRTLAVGAPVEVRWTNCHRFYREPGTITKINRASVRVALDRDVIVDGTLYYEAGREIIVPRLTITSMDRWSGNNGVFPRV